MASPVGEGVGGGGRGGGAKGMLPAGAESLRLSSTLSRGARAGSLERTTPMADDRKLAAAFCPPRRSPRRLLEFSLSSNLIILFIICDRRHGPRFE